MEDYRGKLYPEDRLQENGNFTVVQSFPEFTKKRLSAIKSSYPNHKLDRFSPVYAIPNVDDLDISQKGPVIATGLWTFNQVAIEPLYSVMKKYLRAFLTFFYSVDNDS
jgi:hypothetical protein